MYLHEDDVIDLVSFDNLQRLTSVEEASAYIADVLSLATPEEMRRIIVALSGYELTEKVRQTRSRNVCVQSTSGRSIKKSRRSYTSRLQAADATLVPSHAGGAGGGIDGIDDPHDEKVYALLAAADQLHDFPSSDVEVTLPDEITYADIREEEMFVVGV